MVLDRVQLESDFNQLLKAIKDTPEKFPAEPFGISRLQRALKLGYHRAYNLQDIALKRGILKRDGKSYKVLLAEKAPNDQ